MFDRATTRAGLATLTGVVASVVGLLALAGGSSAAVPGCGAYAAQGDAQDAFLEVGGSPARNVGGMDPDGDGVACEDLAAPYKGYATIGYNRKKQFLYGVVTMPVPSGGQASCLFGNKNHPDSARRLNVFKVRSDGDKPLLGRYKAGAEAQPETGTLIWKVERPELIPAKYYVSFDEKIRTSPYGRNPCPGFSSEPTLLPRPRNS
ncbi:MAG: hypothetical protein QOE75_2864 [Solirubrobacterales bacterium]|jgi:hypothetical protein|nr:hypothetical protein [Solirubrobacterales bacterium]